MSSEIFSNSTLSSAPLGAGDLIDRAVRVYRQNFWTFVLIAAPPVVSAAFFSVLWTLFVRWLFPMGVGAEPLSVTFYLLVNSLGSMLVVTAEFIAMLTIMGGASRNFVRNLLFGEPITFKETYRNVKNRLAGLIVASAIIAILVGVISAVIFYVWMILMVFGVAVITLVFQAFPMILTILSIIFAAASFVGALWLFFMLVSRLAYVPQAMLVESRGIAASFSRSLTLAKGNVRRVAALITFSVLVTYSAIAILYLPLAWIAWAEGVDVFGIESVAPAWYQIASQMIGQVSIILLAPVWMAGLCLLYVDERVRHEGYDIELMAAQQLGEIPDVPTDYHNPLQPALASENTEAAKVKKDSSSLTVVSLK